MPDNLLSFLLACIIIELTPGPNMAYLAALSSAQGKKAGFSMVAGISTGLLVIGMVSAFGAATLVLESPALYASLRWAGILYMVWLAWESWRSAPLSYAPVSNFDVRYFRRGFITNVLNPKAMIFYITVFPTFVDPHHSVMMQSLVMTILYVGIATCIHSGITLLGNRMHSLLANPRITKMNHHFFAMLLLAIAVWFAWSTRHISYPAL